MSPIGFKFSKESRAKMSAVRAEKGRVDYQRKLDSGKATCRTCSTEKPLVDFPAGCLREDKRPSYNICDVCYKEEQMARALFSLYALTTKERDGLFAFQKGVCALCGRSPKKYHLNIDHEHGTGKLRGGLCFPCNKFLGYVRDNVSVLEAAIAYLKDPPATKFFGCDRYGRVGRTSNTGPSRIAPCLEGHILYRCGCRGETKRCQVHKQPSITVEQKPAQADDVSIGTNVLLSPPFRLR